MENPSRVADESLLFLCLAGSHAYGMATPSSDIDLRGVYVADRNTRLSPFPGREQIEGPGDQVIYELSKFLRLIADQNPSVLEILWAPEDCVRFESPGWFLLRERRGEFLSKKLRQTCEHSARFRGRLLGQAMPRPGGLASEGTFHARKP